MTNHKSLNCLGSCIFCYISWISSHSFKSPLCFIPPSIFDSSSNVNLHGLMLHLFYFSFFLDFRYIFYAPNTLWHQIKLYFFVPFTPEGSFMDSCLIFSTSLSCLEWKCLVYNITHSPPRQCQVLGRSQTKTIGKRVSLLISLTSCLDLTHGSLSLGWSGFGFHKNLDRMAKSLIQWEIS